MTGLFESLSRAVDGAPLLALSAAFAWGVLSVLLSPCHLASIPLVVGFINGQGEMTGRRAFQLAGLFALGILATIAVLGALTAAAGRMLGDVGPVGNFLVAGIFLLVGLNLMDVLPLRWSGMGAPATGRRGPLAALGLGLLFGVALGPCTFAYMAPMLAVVFSIASTWLAYGILLLAVYGLGHCSVIVLAGTSGSLVQRYLDWSGRSRGTVVVKRVCGLLVVLAGLYLVWSAP